MEKINTISAYKKASSSINGGVLNRHHSLSSARPFSDVHPPLTNFAGLLQSPPNLAPFPSYPPYSMRHQTQPPLLPLPVSPPAKRAGITRGVSLPPPTAAARGGNRKTQVKTSGNFRSRDSTSLTSKKSISKSKEASKPVGPDPKELSNGVRDAQKKLMEEFSGSGMFAAISPPPPSSLPLPTFSLRPKRRSCTAEAGGVFVDAGATDNLCRLLHLR